MSFQQSGVIFQDLGHLEILTQIVVRDFRRLAKRSLGFGLAVQLRVCLAERVQHTRNRRSRVRAARLKNFERTVVLFFRLRKFSCRQ